MNKKNKRRGKRIVPAHRGAKITFSKTKQRVAGKLRRVREADREANSENTVQNVNTVDLKVLKILTNSKKFEKYNDIEFSGDHM